MGQFLEDIELKTALLIKLMCILGRKYAVENIPPIGL